MTPPPPPQPPMQKKKMLDHDDDYETKKQQEILAAAAEGREEEEELEDDDEGRPRPPAPELFLSQLIDEMERLDEVEKSAYEQAIERVPELVAKESDPAKFLRAEDNDVRAAAVRLAGYWKIRLEMFGPERAFLPMISTGFGALSADDVEIMRKGFVAPLPRDRRGRSVLLVNHERITANREAARPARFRAFFYILQAVSEKETSRSRGVVLLRTGNRPALDPAQLGKIFSQLLTHPIRLKGLYMLCRPSSAGEKRLWTQTLFPDIMRVMRGGLGQRRAHFLAALSTEEMVRAMERDPTLKALDHRGGSLPPCLGGSWGYEKFAEWCDMRARYERGLYAPKYEMVKKPAKTTTTVGDNKPPEVIAAPAPAAPPAVADTDDADADDASTSIPPCVVVMAADPAAAVDHAAADATSVPRMMSPESVNSGEDDSCSFSSYDSSLERTLQSAEEMIAQRERYFCYHHPVL